MSREDNEAQLLLRCQLKPALVLDGSGVITAINMGGLRLVGPSTTSGNSTLSAVVGKKIADLGMAISPRGSPVLWTWDQILDAAANSRNKINDNPEPTKLSTPNRDIFQITNDFWDLEAEKQSLIESNVFLVKTATAVSTVRTPEGVENLFKMKARANVSWYPSGLFLVVFDRPSMPPTPAQKTSPGAERPQYLDEKSFAPTHWIPPPESEPEPGNRTPGANQVTSSLIPYIMATLDEEGQVMQFSDSWYRFTGLSKEESLGSGWISAIHPGDVLAMTSAWANILHNKQENWTHEARYLEASSGEYYWFMIRAQAYKDASGKVICWYASMLDINDGMKARREVSKRQQSMLTLISQTDVLLWGVDRSNRLYIREGGLKWDPPAFPTTSRPVASQETAQAIRGTKELDPREHGELVSVVQAVLLGHKMTSTVEHKEGERHFRTIFVAERAAHGAGTDADNDTTEAALALTFETTDQIVQSTLRLENERLALNEKAASEASAMKSRFLANMSHEIRTPISGIIGLSELLSGSGVNKDQTELVTDIRISAQFLLALVNDILDLSKMDVGQLGIECIPFSLRETIRDTLVPLQLQAKEKGIDLGWTCNVDTAEATFLGDSHRLRQILTNLIGNSLKFTKAGTIQLEVTAVQRPANDAADTQFVVRDTGIGIAEEARELLFKPFSQADSSTARIYGGTGLGLSICRELVGLMGGSMTLQSTLGEGTTMTFNIPFKLNPSLQLTDRTLPEGTPRITDIVQSILPHPTQKQHPGSAESKTSGPTILILVVDDNAINRKVNSLLISRSGYAVVTACNGQEALDYLCKTSSQPQPDMVFMDCMMPVIDGFEATRRIRNDADLFSEKTRKLPIVAVTASGLQSDKERCWEAGMDDYICRPVSQHAFLNAVLKWTFPKTT